MTHCIASGVFLSNFLGTVSSVFWFFVLLPQLYTNYKNKNSDAVSLMLILLWIFGDFLSMFSAQVKNISPIVTYIAIYHIILGAVFAIQIVYYRYYKLANRYIQIFEEFEETSSEVEDYDNIFLLTNQEQLFIGLSTLFVFIVKLYFYLNPTNSIVLADTVAWATTFIFIASRFPQILLNVRRKTTEGLSVYSFVTLNVANYLFLASILVNVCDVTDTNLFLVNNLQWILGAGCTSLLDIVILYQFWLYS